MRPAMPALLPAIIDQIIQAVAAAVWDRPELARLRESIREAFRAGTFSALLTKAFEDFASQTALPQFFDQGFIAIPAVQEHLADYIVKGQSASVQELADLYARRFLKPADAPDGGAHLEGYLRQVRETFATDETYGPILPARDVQSMNAALNNLRGKMHGRFDEVISRLDALLKEPEIKTLVERKTGTHIFLSYRTSLWRRKSAMPWKTPGIPSGRTRRRLRAAMGPT